MTSIMRLSSIGLISVLYCLACGGAAVPHDQLSTAQAAVRAAEVGGAPSEPQAALHMKRAQDQIDKAKAMIEEGENEQARRLLDQANADAELALGLAQRKQSETEAAAMREELEELKAKLAK